MKMEQVKPNIKNTIRRLSQCYFVVDKDGNIKKFKPNSTQIKLCKALRHYRILKNIMRKARSGQQRTIMLENFLKAEDV